MKGTLSMENIDLKKTQDHLNDLNESLNTIRRSL